MLKLLMRAKKGTWRQTIKGADIQWEEVYKEEIELNPLEEEIYRKVLRFEKTNYSDIRVSRHKNMFVFQFHATDPNNNIFTNQIAIRAPLYATKVDLGNILQKAGKTHYNLVAILERGFDPYVKRD